MSENSYHSSVIFDLDNTLYPRESGLFSFIDTRINIFIQEKLKISSDQASRLRKHYQQSYGITLRGLMEEHGITPEEYLQFVHEVPVEEILSPRPLLEAILREIPRPKYIFTNGSKDHALRVIRSLSIEEHFSGIFDISFTDYIPKPELKAYRSVLKAISMNAEEVVFVDDLRINLLSAGSLGMTTVFFNEKAGDDEKVDFIARDLPELKIVFTGLFG